MGNSLSITGQRLLAFAKDWENAMIHTKLRGLLAFSLMSICLSACGENAVQTNKKTADATNASASKSVAACQDFKTIETQAIKGDAKSQYELAKLFEEGICVAQSRISATYWYGNAAKKDYADAKARREAILSALEESAKKGDANAQYDLAWMYHHGYGLKFDYPKAIEWYERSAKQGQVQAQYTLGEIYSEDMRIEQDLAKAKHWFEAAAKQGNAEAQNKLSTMYYKGNGIGQDYGQARYWAEQSANQGNSQGQVLLGWLYEKGYGVEQDYAKARYWYEKSAMQGNQKAQDNLASIYYNGKGVPKDLKKAQYWSDKAMQQGDCGGGTGCR